MTSKPLPTFPALETATPAEIDTVLAAIYEIEFDARLRTAQIAEDIARVEKRIAAGRASSWDQQSLEGLLRSLETAREAVAAAVIAGAPGREEFTRRGGWTRAWVVYTSGGHIHRSMACSTCYPTTRFGWLPQVSGLDESEIVDLAGEGACSVCYPDAPVAVRSQPRRLDTAERIAEREAREAAKTAAAAKREAKAIEPVSVYDWTNPRTGVERRETLSTIHAARGFLTDHAEALANGGRAKRAEDVDAVAAAVAAKEGKDVETVLAEAAKRAAKRR